MEQVAPNWPLAAKESLRSTKTYISDNFGFINTRGPSIGVPSGLWMDFMDLCKKHVSAIFGFTGFKWSK